MVRSRNVLDEGSDAVFSAPEPELLRALAQLDVRSDLLHLAPGHANSSAATDPGCNPAKQSRSVAPDSGPTENRHHLEILPRTTLQGEIVDLSAAPALGVQQLVIEHVQPEVDRVGQFWPTLVRIMSGTAVRAITTITTRYSRPRTFASPPFVYSRMYFRSFATRKMGM